MKAHYITVAWWMKIMSSNYRLLKVRYLSLASLNRIILIEHHLLTYFICLFLKEMNGSLEIWAKGNSILKTQKLWNRIPETFNQPVWKRSRVNPHIVRDQWQELWKVTLCHLVFALFISFRSLLLVRMKRMQVAIFSTLVSLKIP